MSTPLSITTDYVTDHGDPQPYLAAIAAAGFTHIHWCHHWRSDYLYANAEIAQIRQWLDEYGLILADIHGSEGVEKFWYAPQEHLRLAGVDLVKNRIDFAARLGADAVVMHAYADTEAPAYQPYNALAWDLMRRSLDELEAYTRAMGVRIAIENLIDFPGVEAGVITPAEARDNFDLVERLLATYPPDFLGVCFDSGHANLGYNRMERLDAVKHRLLVLHLHDNDGVGDQHRLLFSGTIDWERLAQMIAASSYVKPISMEVAIHRTGIDDEAEFLRQAYATGVRFTDMVAAIRANS